jgi:hypothetical protein
MALGKMAEAGEWWDHCDPNMENSSIKKMMDLKVLPLVNCCQDFFNFF